jgi:hypothetical protein
MVLVVAAALVAVMVASLQTVVLAAQVVQHPTLRLVSAAELGAVVVLTTMEVLTTPAAVAVGVSCRVLAALEALLLVMTKLATAAAVEPQGNMLGQCKATPYLKAVAAVVAGVPLAVVVKATQQLQQQAVLAARLSQQQHLIRYRIAELFTEQHNEYHVVL